ADYGKAQGWNVVANLNNDNIGHSCGSDTVCNDTQVRGFSEGPRWQGGDALRGQVRSQGGENDSPSRNLSRYLARLAGDLSLGLEVRQIWRNDRFGRGGDHTEFLNAGFPAVRMSVAVENYNWQHQDLRTATPQDELEASGTTVIDSGRTFLDRNPPLSEPVQYGDTIERMDFRYLRRVTALNVAALAALARAPAPPAPVVSGAVSTSTGLMWTPVSGATEYVVRWRRTDASNWQHSLRINDETPGVLRVGHWNDPVRPQTHVPGMMVSLTGIRVDDWVFGVSSVAADGSESPVASAVPGGAFRPYVPPAPASQ
ncbi:MAG: hypothetical protein ACT4N8_15065, partial [Sphingosinicella sp.]